MCALQCRCCDHNLLVLINFYRLMHLDRNYNECSVTCWTRVLYLHENSRLFCESFINTFLCKGLNNFEKEIVATNTRSDIFFIWNFWASHNYLHYLLTETINEKALKPARHKQHRTDSIAAYLWFLDILFLKRLMNYYRMSVSTSLRIRRTSRTWIMTSLMELLNCLNIFL